ncbi:MAG: metallopeptidase family protein [Gemmatimonadales bacterium]|nr:metallopeptidase family protein [Gemmatimonadales bacterium]
MRLDDFRAMVRGMADEVPAEYLDGVLEIVVSPRTVPHPTRDGVFTLGECVPVAGGGSEGPVQSRVVLHHGSFAALAADGPAFDWADEARQTLLHELRHHLEWRAQASELEAFDRAAEHNFARQEGESFDPLFHLDGEVRAPGVYQVDDDWFIDCAVRRLEREVAFTWRGRRYAVSVPDGTGLPCHLEVEGVAHPPPGDLVLVLRRHPSVLDLFRRQRCTRAAALARPLADAAPLDSRG